MIEINWQSWVMGDIHPDIWLRIDTNGNYLEEEELCNQELAEYLHYFE